MGCPKGQYYCNDEQMCKSIPSGHKVLKSGELVKEDLKKQISNEFENLTKSRTFNSFKKDALDIKGKLEGAANKFNKPEVKQQLQTGVKNIANTAIDQLTKAAKKKVNSFGEGAYEGGGTIINPSGLRNNWGIPPVKSVPSKTYSEVDLIKMMTLGGAQAKKKVNPKKNPIINASYKPKGNTIEEIDGSKVALGLTAGVFGAGIELARRGKKFADKLKEKMDKRTKLKEETQGGINIETYTDGIQFNEIETVNIIEPPKMKSSAHLTFIENLKGETK